jgi:hypothetical protein
VRDVYASSPTRTRAGPEVAAGFLRERAVAHRTHGALHNPRQFSTGFPQAPVDNMLGISWWSNLAEKCLRSALGGNLVGYGHV